MSKKLNIAIVGITGVVGEAMRDILQERNFPVNDFYPIASANSKGKVINFNGKPYYVEDIAEFDFSKVDIALFSAGSQVSKEYATKAASMGCIVIDNTSYFREDPEIPLIIPEVNPDDLANFKNKNIIANPNCSTIQMLVALKPLYDNFGIEKIQVSTYQAVSGSGRKAISELIEQTGELLNGRSVSSNIYPQQIAFNVFPHIDDFLENGFTKEEMKMINETHKILGDKDIEVSPTTVRVPVIYGHSEAIHIETKYQTSREEIIDILQTAPGVSVLDHGVDIAYPTPLKEGSGQDSVFVGRIRRDLSNPYGINLWVVADNVRKGAALNSVQIAEMLF